MLSSRWQRTLSQWSRNQVNPKFVKANVKWVNAHTIQKSSYGTSCWWNLLIELKPKKSYLQSNSLLVNVHSAVLHDSIMIIAIMEFKNNWEKYLQLCFHILCIFWHITSLQVLEIFLNCWHMTQLLLIIIHMKYF